MSGRVVYQSDADNIAHLTACSDDGCQRCAELMAAYQTCDTCHQWGHGDVMYVEHVGDGNTRVHCHSCALEQRMAP